MKTIPEKYQGEIEGIISAARGFLSDGLTLQPFVFLGKKDLPLLRCPMNMSDNAAKNVSAAIVRELARISEPDFAIMISEAWSLDATKFSMEKYNEYMKTHDGIEEHPDRQDVVMITLETPTGFWFGKSVIKSLGDKGRGFDDVEFTFTDQIEGRFACFLPHSTVH